MENQQTKTISKDKIEVLTKISNSDEISKAIEELKSKRISESPDIESIKKEIDPNQHKVMDETIRKDKMVKADEGETADAGTKIVSTSSGRKEIPMKYEKVSRVALAYQDIIVSRAVAFLFGFPVEYVIESEDKNELAVQKAVERIFHDNKEKFFNWNIATELFSFTEVAELWFPVELEKEHNTYGFPTKFKLRVIPLKPSEDMQLFPYFDETKNMLAFSRYYKVKESDKDVEYFETYTDAIIYKFRKETDWEIAENYPIENIIGKIPIIYAAQKEKEWAKVQNIIESDEELRSNFSDINKYHASPTIFVKGKILGFAKKGEAGKVIEGDEKTEAKYMEWSQASESVKTEHEMNREDIFALTQTPDVSFNNVKSLGNLGVAAQKMIFFDAHLKVKKKEEIIGEYLQRRVNVVKAFIAQFNNALSEACDNAIITPEITPYMMGDEQEKTNVITTAVSSGIMSRRTAIKELGKVTDEQKEYDNILEEERLANTLQMFPPAQ